MSERMNGWLFICYYIDSEYILLIIMEEICPENKSPDSAISEPLKLEYSIFQLASSVSSHLPR